MYIAVLTRIPKVAAQLSDAQQAATLRLLDITLFLICNRILLLIIRLLFRIFPFNCGFVAHCLAVQHASRFHGGIGMQLDEHYIGKTS